jgi:tripartite ATP-independent transporter DctP family solute receptor
MRKQFISTVICAAMVAATLAACGGSSAAPATTAAKAAPAAQAATTAAASKAAAATTAAAKAAPAAQAATTAAAAAGAQVAVNEAASKDPKVTLVMAEVNPSTGTICGEMDKKFIDEVQRISGGSITIDFQDSGKLGVEADVLDGMTTPGVGTVDISRISAFALNNYGAKKSVLLSLPFTFQNRDHYWKFVNSDLGKEILDESETAGTGVKGLFYGEEGFRHFFTAKNKPVTKVEDLKGMKIRVSNDPIMQAMVTSLGATPSPVSMSEIYTSLQNGTIDGAEQPTANYYSNKFQEVGPNFILDGHTLGAIEVVIDDDSWNTKLTKNQQQVLVDAGKVASDYCHQISEKKEKETLEKLKAEGCVITEVQDKTPWQTACKPIADKYAAGDLAATYQKILDLAK